MATALTHQSKLTQRADREAMRQQGFPKQDPTRVEPAHSGLRVRFAEAMQPGTQVTRWNFMLQEEGHDLYVTIPAPRLALPAPPAAAVPPASVKVRAEPRAAPVCLWF